MNIIRTDSLTKFYRETAAVSNLNLNIDQGEIYGFLGLNGAGKTTTIRMLLGMIKPSGGSFKLFGSEIGKNLEIWNQVGFLVETPYSYPNLTVRENLGIIVKLRGLDFKTINDIISQLDLIQFAGKKVRELSLGNRQRLGLAKALIHKPRLLILDEPINGLDPKGIVEVRELLAGLARNGTTIFLSSHILGEIAKLAGRIGIIHNGILLQEIKSLELSNLLEKKLIVDTVDNSKALQILAKQGYDPHFDSSGLIFSREKFALEHPEDLCRLLVLNECPPRQLYHFTEDLEHYFLRITGKEAAL